MALLEVDNLVVKFGQRHGAVTAIRGISFAVERGERLGIVGESGAGKSVAAFSILDLLSEPGFVADGQIRFDGQDLRTLDKEALRQVRGQRISMIFQDPMMTLNPVLSIGVQMIECLQAHRKISSKAARAIALEKLRLVQMPSPEKRLDQYPHELSGGMKQRIIIAIALLLDPELIIADEPTTALDVTIQAEIMQLLLDLCSTQNLALILITHDLGVVSQITDRTLVMYAGRIIEQGPTKAIINDPQHPYTQGLIKALPQQTLPGERLNQIPGSMPTLEHLPSGCAFHPRCAYVRARCDSIVPGFTQSGESLAACHMVEELVRDPGVELIAREHSE
ncbi:MAG: methionine ABC transporter ATP-binding protein [unclassified Hahellaceae]|nr:methionine ABC transporter ATP-binding protein [Hahellaceae bacterium]|tara:strand:- start:41334 stop:42341 length:1008 start_codon:yes stop_codon:yes gene_type:complete